MTQRPKLFSIATSTSQVGIKGSRASKRTRRFTTCIRKLVSYKNSAFWSCRSMQTIGIKQCSRMVLVSNCVDEQTISQIPRSLVPQSILYSFITQRRNHIQRMIKHECQLYKTGKWSLQNVSARTMCRW